MANPDPDRWNNEDQLLAALYRRADETAFKREGTDHIVWDGLARFGTWLREHQKTQAKHHMRSAQSSSSAADTGQQPKAHLSQSDRGVPSPAGPDWVAGPRLSDAEVLAVLSRSTLFSGLGPNELAGVVSSCLQRRVTRGQFLCYQGDPGDRLFIVATGLVKVVLTSEQGEELVLRTLGPSEVFGELAALDQVPRSASVVAVQPTDVLMLNRPVIISLMRTYPSVMDAMLVSLSRLVRLMTVQTGELAFLDLTGRLARLLLRLAKDHGLTSGNGGPAVVDLGLTQSDLGAMIGASRPAVNRVLESLAARGVIELNGSAIVVRDLAALRRRAGS